MFPLFLASALSQEIPTAHCFCYVLVLLSNLIFFTSRLILFLFASMWLSSFVPVRLTQLSKPSCVVLSVAHAPHCSSSLWTWWRHGYRPCRTMSNQGGCTHIQASSTFACIIKEDLVHQCNFYHDGTYAWFHCCSSSWSYRVFYCSRWEYPKLSLLSSFFYLCIWWFINVPVIFLISSYRGPKVGMFTVFLNVVKTENFFSLWKGLSPVSNQPLLRKLKWNQMIWWPVVSWIQAVKLFLKSSISCMPVLKQ